MSPDAIRSGGVLHEGLAREELDHETQRGRLHLLTTKDHRAVAALVFCFALIFAVGIAVIAVARHLHTSETVRMSDATVSVDLLVPDRK
jgi:hypothetical protein